MKDNPLVSIVTPVLNSIPYLETCIRSVLDQSYPHVEQVFVDGGSTDGTVELLTEYSNKYPERVRFISGPDKGAVDAWNKGITMARGDIYGWIGADDYYETDAVATIVEFFKENPDEYLVYGGFNVINEKGEVTRTPIPRDFNLKAAINGTCAVITTSAFYKKEVIERVGLMDTSINTADYDFWIRAGMVFPIHRIDKILSHFMMTRSTVTGRKGALRVYAREGFIINRRYGGSIITAYTRYIRFSLMEWLNPILGFTYPFLERLSRR